MTKPERMEIRILGITIMIISALILIVIIKLLINAIRMGERRRIQTDNIFISN